MSPHILNIPHISELFIIFEFERFRCLIVVVWLVHGGAYLVLRSTKLGLCGVLYHTPYDILLHGHSLPQRAIRFAGL
jgi:hypothetical protein